MPQGVRRFVTVTSARRLVDGHAKGTLTDVGALTGTPYGRRRTCKVERASSATPTAYGVQVIPVAPPLHEKVGTVQPELVNAVKARTKPRTTLYFIRDMNHSIPSEEKCYARDELYYVSTIRNTMGSNEFAKSGALAVDRL